MPLRFPKDYPKKEKGPEGPFHFNCFPAISAVQPIQRQALFFQQAR